MKIAVDSDQTGGFLKRKVLAFLKSNGFEAIDLASVGDYPDIAYALACRVRSGEFERGVLLCGTGQGMAMAANKVRGIYAGCAADVVSARRMAESNNAQILTMGADVVGPQLAEAIVAAFVFTEFKDRPSAKRMRELEARQ